MDKAPIVVAREHKHTAALAMLKLLVRVSEKERPTEYELAFAIDAARFILYECASCNNRPETWRCMFQLCLEEIAELKGEKPSEKAVV